MDAGFFSSAKRLRLSPGRRVDQSRLRGYYIDFHPKTLSDATWPPPWLQEGYGYVKLAQVALGHFEDYVATGDAASFAFADSACAFLVAAQQPAGTPDEGGWRHGFAFVHRSELRPPWLSAMAQGQAASLLLRVYVETGRGELAESALLAMRPFERSAEQGGVTSTVGTRLFAEEYPTVPGSHVLNGAVFALWGVRDVAETLNEPFVRRLHDDLLEGLVATLPQFDLGNWSRYDLHPQPPVNVASSFYTISTSASYRRSRDSTATRSSRPSPRSSPSTNGGLCCEQLHSCEKWRSGSGCPGTRSTLRRPSRRPDRIPSRSRVPDRYVVHERTAP